MAKNRGPNVSSRVEALSAQLLELQHEYYVLSAPSVSDREYDRLFDELVELEQQHPELRRDTSPTQRVGSDLTQDLPEVPHRIPVLSLDKAYSTDELLAWSTKLADGAGGELVFCLEEKIDGSSIVLYYEDGQLTQAVTRGSGRVGNDVTANVRTIGSVPLRVGERRPFAVRGEIFLSLDDFAHMNESAEMRYANPRNFASGAVRRVKSREVAAIPLRLFAYELAAVDGAAQLANSHAASIDLLREWGFPVNAQAALFGPVDRCDELRQQRASWEVHALGQLGDWVAAAEAARPQRDYEIDGLVMKVDDLALRDTLGTTGHHPRWALAYKFDAPEGVTTVLGIDLQVGRTGRITPVARVSPVQIAGSTISNVTLHNRDYIATLELALGDTVAVSKRGDVIPAVERVLDKNADGNTTWKLPTTCPSCRRRLRVLGAHHFCVNPECPDQLRGRLRFFAARGQMDIEHLGGETIDTLIDTGLVADVDDIYTFDADRLLKIEGFGPRKVELIRAGIEASRSRPFESLMPSLGMPEIGPKLTELLIDAGYRDIDSWLALADRASDDEAQAEVILQLQEVDGIGEKTAATLIEELNRPDNRRRIAALRAVGLVFSAPEQEAAAEPEGQVLVGQSWCITGSFASLGSREAVSEVICEHGGRVVGSVTSKTTHLLAGDGGGGKRARAEQLGIAIVDEPQFLALIGSAADPSAG